MSKFKVGDRVVSTRYQVYGGGRHLAAGYEGIVTHVEGDCIAVDNKLGKNNKPVFWEEAFKLAEPTFKKGDRVRLTTTYRMAAAKGTLATVEAPPILHEDGNTYLKVVWDAEGRHQQAHGWYYPKYFELVEDAAIGFDEFKQQLHTLLDKALKAGIGVNSIDVRKVHLIGGKYVLTSLEIDAEVSGYSGESK